MPSKNRRNASCIGYLWKYGLVEKGCYLVHTTPPKPPGAPFRAGVTRIKPPGMNAES
jgi:hypothetical protein